MYGSRKKTVERLTVTATLNYVQIELMISNNVASVDVYPHTQKIRQFKYSACSEWFLQIALLIISHAQVI